MMLPIANIQRFSTQDGPGVRTTVFLKGCPLRCKWCHNPETQLLGPQLYYIEQDCINCGICVEMCPTGAHYFDESNKHCYDRRVCTGCFRCVDTCPTNAIEAVGFVMSAEEIINIVLKDQAFYQKVGGITISGGEPLMHLEGCISLLELSKAYGLSTVVDTSGYFDKSILKAVIPLTDLFLWDFKDGNNLRHQKYTEVSNEGIINNLLLADSLGANTVLSCIMVKGVNMDESNYLAIKATESSLNNCQGVKLLPYHPYASRKYKQLGLENSSFKDWIPEDYEMMLARERLTDLGVRLYS